MNKTTKAYAIKRINNKKIVDSDMSKQSFMCISKTRYFARKWIRQWKNSKDFEIIKIEIKIYD